MKLTAVVSGLTIETTEKNSELKLEIEGFSVIVNAEELKAVIRKLLAK